MSASLERAVILIEQARYDLAEQELRRLLAIEPNNAVAHALLSLCLVEKKQYREAIAAAQLAVHLAPDSADTHYTLARVFYSQNQLDKAKLAIQEAIRLVPEEADYFALLSTIQLTQGDRIKALANAEQGLRIEPEHLFCLNLRAMALFQLSRHQEAQNTLDLALAQDPENAVTYTTQGWAFLYQGDAAKALKCFREALRLNPEQERARKGMIEALKARYLIYRLILQFDLWLSRLSWSMRLFIIFSLYFIGIFKLLFLLLLLLLGITKPLFTLMLRFDRYGRLMLSREEIVAANWSGLGLLLAASALITWSITSNLGAAAIALVFLFLVKFVTELFDHKAGWERKVMGIFIALLAIIGLLLATSLLFMNQTLSQQQVGTVFLYTALIVFAVVFVSFAMFAFGMFFYLLSEKLRQLVKLNRIHIKLW